MGPEGSLPVPAGAEVTRMDYEFYPQALGNVIRKVHEVLPIPIMVTENGIATADDARRTAYIEQALSGVESCIADGIPVVGYCHWSLLDNCSVTWLGLCAPGRISELCRDSPRRSIQTPAQLFQHFILPRIWGSECKSSA